MRKVIIRDIIVLGIVALVPSLASADAVVRIRSDQPANAYLDGKLAGSTPLTISKLRAGSHTVKIENAQTGEIKIFNVASPAAATTEKDIDVAWEGAARVQPRFEQEPETTEVVQTTVVQPREVVYVQPRPVPVVVAQPVYRSGYRPSYGRSYRYDRDYLRAQQEERDKVRSRNVLLGAGVANEIFNKGSSKGLVRGVSLGGALLNEVLRSGR